jgi:hypothetical protein
MMREAVWLGSGFSRLSRAVLLGGSELRPGSFFTASIRDVKQLRRPASPEPASFEGRLGRAKPSHVAATASLIIRFSITPT